MNFFKLENQDGNFIGYCKYLAIGKRQENQIIGDKLLKLLKEKNITKEQVISDFGNSYRDTVERVLNNDEIPKDKFIKKLTKYLNVNDDYFKDGELENIIVTDNNIIVGTYTTNQKAKDVFNELKKLIISDKNYIKIPQEKEV